MEQARYELSRDRIARQRLRFDQANRLRQAKAQARQAAYLDALVVCAGRVGEALKLSGTPQRSYENWRAANLVFCERADELRSAFRYGEGGLVDAVQSALARKALGTYPGRNGKPDGAACLALLDRLEPLVGGKLG